MNKEVWERLQEAGQYQRKAINCLLPKECRPHIEAMQEEMRQIGKIVIRDMINSQAKKEQSEEAASTVPNRKKGKITIE